MNHRVNIVTAVNAANVSKSGDVYTVKDVVHAIDGIVLNQRLYTGNELVKSVAGLEGRPAPAGHPKDKKGRHISAANGEALAAAWIGAYCVNSRYEGGRAMCDIVINAAQAKAMPVGSEVIKRLDAAIDGTNADPIGVSSGLMLQEVEANGESRGKKYTSIATNMQFDHLAILINETPAGTPEEGIGMFVNSEGDEEPVELVALNAEPGPEDKRHAGFLGWLRKLVTNDEISFDQIRDLIYAALPEGAWPREVYAKYLIWTDRADKLWRQDYSIGSDGSLSFTSQPVEVTRKVEYEPISNSQEGDILKDQILAALNAAGIQTAGLDDSKLLAAYNAFVSKPHVDALTAANSKLAEIEIAANAAKDAELTALATQLAVNSMLKPEDFKAMGLDRCKELAAAKGAAPVLPGNQTTNSKDEFEGYDINAL